MNLNNHFLIASPDMKDPLFSGSLVYVYTHNDEGALGIIINRPSPIMMEIIFGEKSKQAHHPMQGQWVMMGGPVSLDRGFVIHTPLGNWQSSTHVDDHIAVTISRDIIEAMGEDEPIVNHALLAIGCSAWTKGQLEREIANNDWLIVEADQRILFELPVSERYDAALHKLGIRPAFLMKGQGRA